MARHHNMNFVVAPSSGQSQWREEFQQQQPGTDQYQAEDHDESDVDLEALVLNQLLKSRPPRGRAFASEKESDDLETLMMKDKSNRVFLDNLKVLYQRRVQSSFSMIDQLTSHQDTLRKAADHLEQLQAQLNSNQISAEKEIGLKKEQLIMEIERLYSLAMKDIEIQIKVKGDLITEKLQEVRDQEIEVA